MSRRPLYSRSGKPRTEGRSPLVAADGITPAYIDTPDEPKGPPLRQRAAQGWTRLQQRHPSMVLVATSVVVMLIGIGAYNYLRPEPQDLSQGRLNEAVNYAIDHRPEQPAETTVDYAKIIPSVVRVDGYDPIVPNESGSPDERQAAAEGHGQVTPPLSTNSALPGYENVAVGTGTVISEDGTILTNLHVAAAAKKLRVIFSDGTEANAKLSGADPENDMAVLRPDKIPDDLKPATLASTQGVSPGDPVEAVGFPFGIGPSASSGIVSGLKREFEGGEGQKKLTNLIQFDAAANPGNSGGPLVDRDGEVIGIVTAILNPSGERTFAGIGFAVPIENAAKGVIGESPL